MRLVCLLSGALAVSGCNPFVVDKGPYGNYCPKAPSNETYCGMCAADSQCGYCPISAQGTSTCPADPCATKCDSSAGGGPAGGSGGTGGGGAGGTSGGGGSAGTDANGCPNGSTYECSQYTQNGNCSVQSCTCYNGTPTAYCGIFYRTTSGAFFWCGSDATCQTIGVYACAQRVAAYCTPP